MTRIKTTWYTTTLDLCTTVRIKICVFVIAIFITWQSVVHWIFNTSVKSVLLYGSETWHVTKTNTNKLQTFTNRYLRNILNIRWPEVVSNEQLWDKTKQTPIETEIRKRKWGWIGHMLRKPASNITRQALDWNPQGKSKVGHTKQTWRRSTDAEIKAAGTNMGRAKEDQPESSLLEGCCCGPLFHKESRGISQVVHYLWSPATFQNN